MVSIITKNNIELLQPGKLYFMYSLYNGKLDQSFAEGFPSSTYYYDSLWVNNPVDMILPTIPLLFLGMQRIPFKKNAPETYRKTRTAPLAYYFLYEGYNIYFSTDANMFQKHYQTCFMFVEANSFTPDLTMLQSMLSKSPDANIIRNNVAVNEIR